MEEIVRFVLVRPPARASAAIDAIRIQPSLQLATRLREAGVNRKPGRALALAAEAGRAALGFRSYAEVPLGTELAAFARAALRSQDDDLSTAFAELKQPFQQFVARAEFARAKALLSDLVACDKYCGRTHAATEGNGLALRAALYLEVLVDAGGQGVAALPWLSRSVVVDLAPRRLVTGLRPLPRLPGAARAPVLKDEIAKNVAALAELRRIPAREFSGGKLTLGRAASTRLSPVTRNLLQQRGIDVNADDLGTAYGRLTTALRDNYAELRSVEADATPEQMVVRMGSHVVEVSASGALTGKLADFLDLATVPATHSETAPVGWGDLMVVRQHLLRYEAMDISHIENVLAGEHKSREHERSTTTERSEVIETETIKEEERDLTSTDRTELQSEASKTMKDQLSMGFDTHLSGSYGPSVEFSVDTSLGYENSKEEAHKLAQKVSREVVQRTASKVSERIKRTVSTKVTDLVRENNIHQFDARTRDAHVTGIYQWVDKISEAQVFNYGHRLMFDVVVPEPAALIAYLATKPSVSSTIKVPPSFGITAAMIDEGNYDAFATIYEAEGIAPPPEPTRAVAKVLEGIDEDTDRGVTHQVADLVLPDGYQASVARVASDFWFTNVDDEFQAAVVVLIGGERVSMNRENRSGDVALNGEQGSISVAMHTFRTPSVVATISVECVRTERAYAAWQLAVWSALKQGSDRQQQRYREDVARAKAEAEARADDETPRRVTEAEIRTELKRLAITLFTRQHFESFDGVEDINGLPGIDFSEAEAEGRYIRFFEHAFEWEQMSYVLYPYFWGRTSEWKARVLGTDEDPTFNEFLKAGAARLVLGVRPNFESAVLHFFETGQVWSGGPLPDITSPQYLSIIDEIKERTQAPGDELPVGEPWEVRLATSLIRLRPQASLPQWAKDSEGRFVPVD